MTKEKIKHCLEVLEQAKKEIAEFADSPQAVHDSLYQRVEQMTVNKQLTSAEKNLLTSGLAIASWLGALKVHGFSLCLKEKE